MVKVHPALAPLVNLGKDVLGQESNLSGPADELVFFRIGLRSLQAKQRSAVRRANGKPAPASGKLVIEGQAESKLV